MNEMVMVVPRRLNLGFPITQQSTTAEFARKISHGSFWKNANNTNGEGDEYVRCERDGNEMTNNNPPNLNGETCM